MLGVQPLGTGVQRDVSLLVEVSRDWAAPAGRDHGVRAPSGDHATAHDAAGGDPRRDGGPAGDDEPRPDDGDGSGGGGPCSPRPRARREDDADPDAEREAWLILVTVPGLGPVTFATVVGSCGSARAALELASSGHGATVLGDELSRRIADHAANGERIVQRVRDLGLAVVTLEDRAYPPRLRAVDMPPPLLFVRGDPAALGAPHAVAVVGTRRPTDRGRSIAGWIGSAVSRAGAVVISGLAIGIDGAAHAAAVAEGMPTVAVLGGGHARLFPRAHERLAAAIVDGGGAVIAEMPPDTSPTRGTFPRRNRLISGLADASIVVEAGRRSGALITAGWALEQGRDCFVVPGPLDSPASAGCHAFLREFRGEVQIVAGIPELLEDLGLALADGARAEAHDQARDEERGEARNEAVSSGATPEAGPETRPPAGREPAGRADAEDDPPALGEAPGHGTAAASRRPSGLARSAGRAATLASLAPVERSVAEVVANGPATVDRLARETAQPVAAVLGALTLLELRGLVAAGYGRYFPAGALLGWEPPSGPRDRRPPRAAAEAS